MEFILFWLAGAFIAGLIANNKGRSAIGFFFLSLILSPLVGILIALAVKSDTAAIEDKAIQGGDEKKCPFCAELIKAEAVRCKHCGADLSEGESKPDELKNKICSLCGATNSGDAHTCQGCSVDL